MNILAIETTSAACSVALHHKGQIISRHKVAPMQQTSLLLPMVEELLVTANIKVQELDVIAYGAGPGSFTGMRIASSATQGLAFAANIPAIAISSLAAIAYAAHENINKSDYLVALDARMGEVYWGHYQVQENNCLKLIGEEMLCLPTEIPSLMAGSSLEEMVAVGDAWNIYQNDLIHTLGVKPFVMMADQLPTAQAVLNLALIQFAQNNIISATEALPSYLIKR